MSDHSPVADTLRFDLDAIEETGHHGRVDNLPTADGMLEDVTVPRHGSLSLMNGWPFPNGLAIDNVSTEGVPMGLTGGMPFDVYPPHLDVNMNSFGGGLDPFGTFHEDAFGMDHLRGPNLSDPFSLLGHAPSSSGESTPSTSSSLTLRNDQAPGLKLEMTPAGTFEPYALPNAEVPLHLPIPAAPMTGLDSSSLDWQPAANQFPFFDQLAEFGIVQQPPYLAFPPSYTMEAPGSDMLNDAALGQFQLPGTHKIDVPTFGQGIPDISAPPLNPQVPPADGPDTVKNRATPIYVSMRSLEQVASLAATHLPPLPKARGKRSRNRRGVVGPNSTQITKRQGRPKRGAAATKATPKSRKAQTRKAGAKRTKTRSSLSIATRATNITKSTNSTYVKPCSPNSKHQCRFNGCAIRCYDKRTLQRHERTHYRADADTYFCPGIYITRESGDPDVEIEGCTCPPWGYSREDALLRHLRNVLGKEWEGYDDPCVQAAMIMGWDPVGRSSVQRLRPYKPQPPED